MSNTTERTTNGAANEKATNFLKLWFDSFTRILQAACTFSPESVPPETLRQIRVSIFEGIAKAWDDYMRSPEFLKSMKQVMDQTITFHKMTTDLLTRIRHETQGVARQDVDSMMLAIHHLEDRMLNSMDDLAQRIRAVETSLNWKSGGKRPRSRMTASETKSPNARRKSGTKRTNK